MDDEQARSSDASQPSSSAPSESTELREDQLQNAVSFLSHPKVRGSPKASKVAFLQQKGLTQAEIDEAFRRVPDSPVATVPAVAQQTQQPSVSALTTTANHLAPQPYPHSQGGALIAHPQQPPPLRWSQVALGAGFAAASVYAVKSLVWPFVYDKYSAWRGTTSAAAAAAEGPSTSITAAASNDMAAVADAIRAQTAEMASSIETLKQLIAGLDKHRPSSPEDHITAAELRQELRGIATSLNEIVGPRTSTAGAPLESELGEIKALLAEYLKTPRSGDQTPSNPAAASTPGTYRSASDRPLSTNQSPDIKVSRPTAPANGNNSSSSDSDHQMPSNYMEVLAMLERGETPPGIRTDIDDKPPNPDQPLPPARMRSMPKPWERSGGGSGPLNLSPVLPEDEAVHSISEASPRHELMNAGKEASSIFEAATSSKGSPGVIAGRLSPVDQRRRGINAPTVLFPDDAPPAPGDYPRSHPASVTTTTTMPEESSQGSGLGRPSSRGWRPPPIPVPTLSVGGSGGEKTPTSGSHNSLGADFASA